MRLVVFIAGAAAGLCLAVAGASASVPGGALGVWHLDENGGSTLIDASGNGQTGTIHDGHWTAAGAHGYALQFGDPAGNPYLSPHPWATFPGTFPFHLIGGVRYDASLSFWVRPVDDGHRTLFWSWNGPGAPDANRFHIYSGWFGTAPPGFAWLGIDYRAPDTNIRMVFAHELMPLGRWNHVVMTRQGALYTLYLNDVAVQTSVDDGSVPLPDYAAGWSIGRMDGGFGAPWYAFNGGIDEIALFDRALTPAEVHALYTWEIAATVDVRPDSMNVRRNGEVVTVYVELPAPADVASIDVATVTMTGPGGGPLAVLRGGEVGDADLDGVPDMTLKFSGSGVLALLGSETSATLTITGSLADGTSFAGSDTVRVIR